MSKRFPPATRLLLLIVILLLTGCQTLQGDQAPKVSIQLMEASSVCHWKKFGSTT
ncbi:hypothetical protein [Paenibacillus sp. OK003]|uniref:hypothetical protein n=1 Tax=Paenibacillus sp. OK003 TaxID=1884380 RepID=UPI0008B655A8|nr:hypothetical protein [Paenibacillus sp. OK003]SEK63683.1 hypothetical protein SAMN05518856_103314 [Paenibacillus sp. OK003]